jgi:hypothetical protein
MIPGRNFFSGACIGSQGQARGFQPAAQDPAPLSPIESADILQAIQGTIMTTLGNTEPTGRYGYILYYKNPLWEFIGPTRARDISAQRLSLGDRSPQDQWPGTHMPAAAYWTYPLSPTVFTPSNTAQGFNPPLRDWAVVEIIERTAEGLPNVEEWDLNGSTEENENAAEHRDDGELGALRPDYTGEHSQVWVRVLDIDRCVDAPGRTPPRPPPRRGPTPTRPGGNGGGWTPDPPKNVSTVNTYFECPLQFIVGYWETQEEAIAARNTEFDRQFTAAVTGGATGADPDEVAGAAASAADNEPLEPPQTEGGYENPSRYDRELRGGGGNELVCPLIEDPNYNICDFYNTEDRSQTMYNLIQTACPDITFNSDGTVDGTCSPLCRDVIINWWDGGDQQSSNCSCQFKKAYQKVQESGTANEKSNMVIRGLHDRVHYDNLAAACTAPGDTNFACPYPETGELSPNEEQGPPACNTFNHSQCINMENDGRCHWDSVSNPGKCVNGPVPAGSKCEDVGLCTYTNVENRYNDDMWGFIDDLDDYPKCRRNQHWECMAASRGRDCANSYMADELGSTHSTCSYNILTGCSSNYNMTGFDISDNVTGCEVKSEYDGMCCTKESGFQYYDRNQG